MPTPDAWLSEIKRLRAVVAPADAAAAKVAPDAPDPIRLRRALAAAKWWVHAGDWTTEELAEAIREGWDRA